MDIEYEAKFFPVEKEEMRRRLREIGAELVRPEFLQKRTLFHLPQGQEIPGGFIRLRDESDRITLTLKVIKDEWEKDKRKIEGQKEIMFEVDDFQAAEEFLVALGCKKKSYQESTRELWLLEDVEITIDEWPFLEPYIEIEADSEEKVKEATKKLGFDYSQALFGSVAVLYHEKYGVSGDVISNRTPRIVFGEENPFKDKGN